MHLIIDADPIVYRSGFVAEATHYGVVAEDENGSIRQAYFKPQDEMTAYQRMKAWLEDNSLTLVDQEKMVVPEPVSHALMLVRQSLESIQKETGFKGRDQMHILLSGPGNFREKLATYRPYKGNRDPDHKPYHYQAIRDYLTQHWKAVVVAGHEADDEASIMAHRLRKRKTKYIIASIDKDLQQIPGIHYDYRLKQQITMSEEEARIVLWQQVLSGDATDNIPGTCGIGAVKAQRIVEEWTDDPEIVESQLWDLTVGVYQKQSCGSNCYYSYEDSERAALENMRLVYLQREPNELWVPPGREPEYLEDDIDD